MVKWMVLMKVKLCETMTEKPLVELIEKERELLIVSMKELKMEKLMEGKTVSEMNATIK